MENSARVKLICGRIRGAGALRRLTCSMPRTTLELRNQHQRPGKMHVLPPIVGDGADEVCRLPGKEDLKAARKHLGGGA